MIVKQIEVRVKPGHMDDYLASQAIWNRETSMAPGALGMFCGCSPKENDVVHLLFFWRSKPDYEHWMATEHDRIAALAKADEHYQGLTVRILEPLLAEPRVLPAGLAAGETFEAADVQLWSEVYRATFILRTAVRLALFTRLAAGPQAPAQLAAALAADPELVGRLCRALCSMGLLETDGEAWSNTGLAGRTLVEGRPGYQGDMILHNSQPGYFAFWSSLGDRFGLPPDGSADDPAARHERFLAAMRDTAEGGQGGVLQSFLDLGACRALVDVGGAPGHYSVELARQYPQLHTIVLDLPLSERLTNQTIRDAGLQDRVRFLAGDYRQGPFPEPADVILFSNVLRGETPEMVLDMLRRAYDRLPPGGRVVIHDLFPEQPPAPIGIRGGMFLLHSISGANMTLEEMIAALAAAGFRLECARRLPRWVVMNGIVVGARPGDSAP